MPEHAGDGEIKDPGLKRVDGILDRLREAYGSGGLCRDPEAPKTCTCGVGPWDKQGVCDSCGGWCATVTQLIPPEARRFRPCQRVHVTFGGQTMRGEIVGTNLLDDEYLVYVEFAGAFRLTADQIEAA